MANFLHTLTSDERAGYRAELQRQLDRIDAAYWRFCRCKKAKPPVLQVPDAYERVTVLKQLLGLRY